MSDETYGAERAQRLIEQLRALAMRIIELDDEALLTAGPELLKRMGDVRTELFHYEVRSTYDTPEAAEHRRLIDQARRQQDALDLDHEGDEPWRNSED
jgi:hypothetical protein